MLRLLGERALEAADALGMQVTARLAPAEARLLKIEPERVSLELALPENADELPIDQIVALVRHRDRGAAAVTLRLDLGNRPGTGHN